MVLTMNSTCQLYHRISIGPLLCNWWSSIPWQIWI